MKLVHASLAVFAIAFATAQAKADTPNEVYVDFAKVYVPDGFDNNDNVQIVGEGLFSNSCYRHVKTTVRVDHDAKTIHLGPVAYKYPGYCLQVVLPFDRVVDVGILQEGKYTVLREGNNQVIGQVAVHATTSKEPDDYMYAPISQAFFQSRGMLNKVYIVGDFPLSCMKMKEIKTQVQPDVLVVLPIAEIDSSIPCVEGRYHFETSADVGFMKPGRYLLHVRSMNGKAINNLVDVR